MRTLGFTLLIASVLLGSGGVAVRSQADGPAEAAAPASGGECSAGTAGAAAARSEVRASPLAPAAAGAKQVIILNTRGHNYRRPGDPPVTPVEVLPAAPRETDADAQ